MNKHLLRYTTQQTFVLHIQLLLQPMNNLVEYHFQLYYKQQM